MTMTYAPKVEALRERVADFMAAYIYPNEAELFAAPAMSGDRWQVPALLEEIKEKARAAGLWNLFLPDSAFGAGLTNSEYAPLAESWGVRLSHRRRSIARRRIRATWKCSCATARRRKRRNGWSPCWRAGSVPPLP